MGSQDHFDILGMLGTWETTETATERYLKMEFVDEGDELDQNIHFHGHAGLKLDPQEGPQDYSTGHAKLIGERIERGCC